MVAFQGAASGGIETSRSVPRTCTGAWVSAPERNHTLASQPERRQLATSFMLPDYSESV